MLLAQLGHRCDPRSVQGIRRGFTKGRVVPGVRSGLGEHDDVGVPESEVAELVALVTRLADLVGNGVRTKEAVFK